MAWWFPWRSNHKAEHAAPQSAMAADVPIQTASEDLLSRGHIAARIADMLTMSGSREGRVFAIRGAWGDGKSSLKNLVAEALEKRTARPHFLEFNPWQWGDSDAIARALFEQMATLLGGDYSPKAAKRAKALRRYGEILIGSSGPFAKGGDDKGLASWFGAAALLLGGIGAGLTDVPIKRLAAILMAASGIALLVGKFLRWRGKDHSTSSLDEVRGDLERRLAGLERPLVIFVDDIDRLEPEQIRTLFRQIKANANLPNIVFVLLYQPSIVEQALEPVAAGEGRQYLEKIVQAHIDLPPIAREKLLQLFTQQLAPVVDRLALPANGFDERRWGNILIGGIHPFLRNLRDVRRLITSIEIHLPLHEGQRVFEVNVLDFVALETLRVFEPDFYARLATNQALLLQSGRFRGDNRDQVDRGKVEALLQPIRLERKDCCTALLKEIFPQIEWALGGAHYTGDTWFERLVTDKRVCTGRHFNRYFELYLRDGGISESDFADFLSAAASAETLEQVIEEFRRGGNLAMLAARCDESVNALPLGDIERLLPALLELGEELSSVAGNDGPFNSPFVSAWRAVSWYLKRVEDNRDRAHLLLKAMRQTRVLAAPAVLISIEAEAHEKPDGERTPELELDDVQALKEAWVKNMEYRLENDPATADHDRFVGHLFRWKDFSGAADAPRAWVTAASADPAMRIRLLTRFVSVGRVQGWGDRVSTKSESFQRDTLAQFFELEELEEWVRKLDLTELPAEQARIMRILGDHLRAWSKGESTDP